MIIEREILIHILRATKETNNVKIEYIHKESRIPRDLSNEVLRKLHVEGLLMLNGDTATVDDEQRLKMAARAVELGADIERASRFLNWEEFEKFLTLSFEANEFQVKKNFRFTWMRKRWEIDILGLKKPIIISADCKHWHRGWSGAASIKSAKSQVERTKALAEASASGSIRNKIGIERWEYAYFIPVILSLAPSQHKFYERTPIVPVLQIRDFLQNAVVYLDEINRFHVSFRSLG
ncbi:hypothetical protein KEJ43_05970 [Candidatus Bathyarchaeota archaeon]|nr:hypothetical protein [Candidatus Bathyarchaeota archaeon]